MGSGGWSAPWNHDDPRAEQHVRRILDTVTDVDVRTHDSLILTLDDPELLKYPIAYNGIYEDNVPSKRLMVVADYDNDVPEYWEWSGTGMFAVDPSNEAYTLGVNYMICALTR